MCYHSILGGLRPPDPPNKSAFGLPGRTVGRTDGRTDGRTVGRSDGRTDGRTEERRYLPLSSSFKDSKTIGRVPQSISYMGQHGDSNCQTIRPETNK